MRLTFQLMVLVALSACVALVYGCEERTLTFAGHQKGADLSEFLESPEKYVGFYIIVVGALESHGEELRMTQFNSVVHPGLPDTAELLIVDSSPGRWFSEEGVTLEPQCTGRHVQVAGELGKIYPDDRIGIVNIETIFLLEDDVNATLGSLCYSSELPEFYKPVVSQ